MIFQNGLLVLGRKTNLRFEIKVQNKKFYNDLINIIEMLKDTARIDYGCKIKNKKKYLILSAIMFAYFEINNKKFFV